MRCSPVENGKLAACLSMKDQKSPSPKRWRRILQGFFYTLFILFVILVTGSMATVGVAAGFVASLVKDEPVRDKDSLEKRITTWSQTSEAFFGMERRSESYGRMKIVR